MTFAQISPYCLLTVFPKTSQANNAQHLIRFPMLFRGGHGPITHARRARCLARVGSTFNECCHCHCHWNCDIQAAHTVRYFVMRSSNCGKNVPIDTRHGGVQVIMIRMLERIVGCSSAYLSKEIRLSAPTLDDRRCSAREETRKTSCASDLGPLSITSRNGVASRKDQGPHGRRENVPTSLRHAAIKGNPREYQHRAS